MVTMTATEASRGFSALLDKVSHERTEVQIVRDGVVVAHVIPPPTAPTYADVQRAMAHLLPHTPRPDDGFADEVLALRDLLTKPEDPWGDD
jgi:antitoxin (DNA-binding transcriptional repressor) of toxin-antitoxin stability system